MLKKFVFSSCFIAILTAMPYKSSEAKRQMLDEINVYYRNKSKSSADDINRFSRTYNSSDAINWYTRAGFLYRIVNRALRTEDIHALYIFRYFIIDLSACLKVLAVDTRARYNTPFHCYRGCMMRREEIEQWNVNMLVATNTFWSSSRNENVAKMFGGIDSTATTSLKRSREDRQQHVLFEIEIDFTRSPELIVADVSHLSTFTNEEEMLFDLGTPLRISDKRYDEEHCIWRIKMTSTSEIDRLDHDYDLYVHQRLSHTNGPMLYGNLLAGALCDYPRAVSYFQRLLRVLPINDENRPNIYCELGRVYRFMGKYQQAIEYFRVALLLQRRSLPQSKFDYGCTLSGLAVVYSEMGDSVRAIRLNTHALGIYHTLFPEDHIEINQILNRLAYNFHQNGQHQETIDLLSKVDRSRKGKIFLTNPQTQLYYTLGLAYKALGKRTEALEYLKQALDLREKWSHKNHPYTARICYELSLLYADENDQHALALEYAQRALQIRQATVSWNKTELKQSIELVERLSQCNDSAESKQINL
jgi:tetratricopeptide (TPR) repeat protein